MSTCQPMNSQWCTKWQHKTGHNTPHINSNETSTTSDLDQPPMHGLSSHADHLDRLLMVKKLNSKVLARTNVCHQRKQLRLISLATYNVIGSHNYLSLTSDSYNIIDNHYPAMRHCIPQAINLLIKWHRTATQINSTLPNYITNSTTGVCKKIIAQ